MLKRGKRGISPLIATVVLIAFAVAIGTMIMNLGSPSTAQNQDCPEVKLEIQTINNNPVFCYDTLNNKLTFIMKNTGDVDINSLRLTITGISSGQPFSEEVPVDESQIKIGGTITKSISYVRSGQFKVEVVPIITFSGKQKSCLAQAATAESIQRCN